MARTVIIDEGSVGNLTHIVVPEVGDHVAGGDVVTRVDRETGYVTTAPPFPVDSQQLIDYRATQAEARANTKRWKTFRRTGNLHSYPTYRHGERENR